MNIINLSVPAGVSSPVAECGAVMIGYVGEGGVTQVVLDFSAWAEAYGDGVVTLGVQRSGDATWYPVVLNVDGTSAAWLVSKTDTDVEGMGVARFAYTVGGAEKRSAVWRFFVDRGLQSPEGDAPDPYESWVETLTELGAETLQNAQDAQQAAEDAEAAQTAAEAAQTAAEEAISHQPVIIDSYWWIWDAVAGKYVNSGTRATGEYGTTNYNDLSHKPSINGVELVGNKSFEDLGEDTITNAELQEIIEQQYSMIFGGT